MSYRYGTTVQTRRQPNERRIMIALLVGFLVVSLAVLLAGRVPISPTPTPLTGPTYRSYVENDRRLLGSYGYTLEGRVHIPIERAMDLVAERGLPTRDNPSPTP
ncbi:MAG TPA: hypothetical protein PKD53_07515 [Chloroflexaceae bacterium]|nr:hypothetical protein [Chloroflexaceae bacterium]